MLCEPKPTRRVCNASSKATSLAAVVAVVNMTAGTLAIKIERRLLQPGEMVELPGPVLAIFPGDWPEERIWDAIASAMGPRSASDRYRG